MTQKEKKLLSVFMIILIIGVVAQGIPYALKSYQEGIDSVEQFKQKRKRLKRLLARKEYWQQEYDKTNAKEKQLLTQLFEGTSQDLIAARVQGTLKKLARKNDIKVSSMSLADFKSNNGWLLITHTMSFKTSVDQLVKLLKMIKESKPDLEVMDVQVNTYRKILTCTLKVVAFNRSAASTQENEG